MAGDTPTGGSCRFPPSVSPRDGPGATPMRRQWMHRMALLLVAAGVSLLVLIGGLCCSRSHPSGRGTAQVVPDDNSRPEGATVTPPAAAPSGPPEGGTDLAAGARAVIRAIDAGDIAGLRALADPQGVYVVFRYYDFAATDDKQPPPSVFLGTSRLGTWVERVAEYRGEEFGGQEFGAALRCLCEYAAECRRGYGDPDVDASTWDHWGERNLGPCIAMKECSSSYLCVGLTRRDGRWVVYRIEYQQH